MIEQTENSLYALIISISKDVGEIKADIKNVQKNVENYSGESVRADEKIAKKLEEYIDYMNRRQTEIKDGIDDKISELRLDMIDFYKDFEKKLKKLEERVDSMEELPKNRIWAFIERFKAVFIAAIISAMVGGCLKVLTDFAKTIRPPEPIVEVKK